MNKVSIVEAYVSLKEWIHSKFLTRSIIYKPLSLIYKSAKHKILLSNPNSHFSLKKIAFATLGFIPVGIFSYYLGYHSASKINFNDHLKYFRSEDEIFSLLSQGRPVMTFMFLPGDLFSEVAHPQFHKIAVEYSQ